MLTFSNLAWNKKWSRDGSLSIFTEYTTHYIVLQISSQNKENIPWFGFASHVLSEFASFYKWTSTEFMHHSLEFLLLSLIASQCSFSSPQLLSTYSWYHHKVEFWAFQHEQSLHYINREQAEFLPNYYTSIRTEICRSVHRYKRSTEGTKTLKLFLWSR